MFYEQKNSDNGDIFKVITEKNLCFPAHLHSSFEFITIIEGNMTAIVDKNKYELYAGDSLLIFPNQPHSLYTQDSSNHLLCLFSPQLVKAYHNIFSQKLPESNIFSLNVFYLNQLFEMSNEKNTLKIKSLLYSICSEFDSNAKYFDKSDKAGNILLDIFQFVETNYATDCSLDTLAAHLSYHKIYLSSYFKQHTNLTFTEYVNRYRISEALYVLKNSNKKIIDIAYECGFNSLRSFNRNFKNIVGVAPNEYRDQK